jgi:hypothetical protein
MLIKNIRFIYKLIVNLNSPSTSDDKEETERSDGATVESSLLKEAAMLEKRLPVSWQGNVKTRTK